MKGFKIKVNKHVANKLRQFNQQKPFRVIFIGEDGNVTGVPVVQHFRNKNRKRSLFSKLKLNAQKKGYRLQGIRATLK